MAELKTGEAAAEGKKKNKKVKKMTLEEIEKKLQEVTEKQGGLTSLYARHLLRRKEILLTGQKGKS